MSSALQRAPLGPNGRILTTASIAAPAYHYQGLPYDATGALAVTAIGGIVNYSQGLPLSINGRIRVNLANGPAYYGPGAAPFVPNGELAMADAAPDHYTSGVPYAANNAVAVEAYVP